jgi:ubiquinone/menaquinone biosynthesis C-methylase UbiE
MDTAQSAPNYVLGHSDVELQRLLNQSRFYGELTEEVFRRAGLAPGMQVLDVGCGAGDVSFLAASIIGPTGSVLGVDRSAESIRLARERAAAAGLSNVKFLEGDLNTLELTDRFDALVGRFVLLYLADPASVLRALSALVRPGGLVVFQEMDMSAERAVPPVPTHDALLRWILETFRRGGVEIDMGSRLLATFRKAGLPLPELLLRARIGGARDFPGYSYLAQTLRSLLPMAERLGVATAAEVQIETMEERLREDVLRNDAVIVLPSLVGAWARIPEAGAA